MAKIFIHEVITDSYGNNILQQIEQAKDSIDIHIDSPGGSVYKGFAIYNALQRKRDHVSTYIDGLAYSAASWIALAANPDRRFMSHAAQFGIHQAMNPMGGNKEELKAKIQNLQAIDEIQVDIYSKSTGIDSNRIRSLMKEGKTMSLAEAKEFGFQEYTQDKIAALFNLDNMNLLETLEKLRMHAKGEDKIPEVEAEAKDKVEAAHKEADTPAEALSANFTLKKEFEEFKAVANPFMDAIVEYIKDQPTKEEIQAMIDKAANEKLIALLGQIKSEGKVPAAHETDFAEKEKVADTFEPLTIKRNIHELLKR